MVLKLFTNTNANPHVKKLTSDDGANGSNAGAQAVRGHGLFVIYFFNCDFLAILVTSEKIAFLMPFRSNFAPC